MDSQTLHNGLVALNACMEQFDELWDNQAKNLLQRQGLYSAEDVTEHLESLRNQDRVLKIGVIGRVKAGKSSLINSLLFDGKEVLPKAATPMTAALTSIGYAEKFCARVCFFDEEDVAKIEKNANKYEEALNQAVEELKRKAQKRQVGRPSAAQPDEAKLRQSAARKINDGGALAAAADLWDRIKKSEIDVKTLPQEQELVADSPESLNQQLYDYVGSEGRYMPFTRELILGMPLESLKGVEVLDTPGLNDPVKSREIRTYERLKECSAAFLVSPTGQFLSAQDFSLAERITAREGTQEVFVVASQVDTQLHGSERSKHNGALPQVLTGLKGLMEQQAARSLGNAENEVLRGIAGEQEKRLILTSGICQTLLLDDGESSDSTASHAMKLLKQNYPSYFSDEGAIRENLALLSGKDRLIQAVDTVQQEKEQILARQEQDFLKAQWSTLLKAKEQLIQHFEKRLTEIKSADIEQVVKKISILEEASINGSFILNSEFQDHLGTLLYTLPSELERVFDHASELVDVSIQESKGSRTETYEVEKEGLFAWAARGTGLGGYEERSRTISTLEPRAVRQAVTGLRRLVYRGLEDTSGKAILQWQKALVSALLRKLRESIGDDLVDSESLLAACQLTASKLQEIPRVVVPELPIDLLVTNNLDGSYEVREYTETAFRYVSELEEVTREYADSVRDTLSSNRDMDVGEKVLGHITADLKQLQDMLEHKTSSMNNIRSLISALEEIQG